MRRKEGLIEGNINQEYVETPYIVGPSNEFGYSVVQKLINSQEGAIVYIYGETGTGKTHLLHLLTHRAVASGKNVYLRSTNAFVDHVKENYFKTKRAFLTQHKQWDFTIIDDFQYLMNLDLKFMPDPLFEIINQQVSTGKVIVFSSDTSPNLAPPYFHDRIINRIMSGYVSYLQLPDAGMKKQYIDFYTKKHEFTIPIEIANYVISVSKNLRAVKGILGYCNVLFEQNMLNLDKLEELTSRIYGNIASARQTTEQQLIHRVYSVFVEYFRASTEEIRSVREGKIKRKTKAVAAVDNVTYYVLRGVVSSERELRRHCLIKRNTETHGYASGKTLYEAITNQNVKQKIEELIQMAAKQSTANQGRLWAKSYQ
jgi:chromosomal replication initiation ATPase DnaA